MASEFFETIYRQTEGTTRLMHVDRQFVAIMNGFVCFAMVVLPPCVHADWPQWGGPQRDFKVSDVKLAATWPADGPGQLWRRPLGDGFSSIVTADDLLITMYRGDEREHIVALNAGTGETIWKYSHEVRFLEGTNVEEFGPGPLSTPLVVQNRVCAVGITGILHCLAVDTGKLIWKRDLLRELGGTNLYRGYSASPILWRDTIILPVGGAGRGLVAFHLHDGSIAWQQQDFAISHVSPIMIRLGQQDQVVVLADRLIGGFNPESGRQLWQHAHPMTGGNVSTTPVYGDDGRLFFSAAYGVGSHCLQLGGETAESSVKELWRNPQMRVHHSNVIRVGDVVYGSSGDFSAIMFVALDLNSGEVLWRDRQLGRASCIYADGRFIVLQEDGTLMLASMAPKGMTIHSRVQVFSRLSWTGPVLDGKQLYIRNRKEIIALELP